MYVTKVKVFLLSVHCSDTADSVVHQCSKSGSSIEHARFSS